MKTKLFLAVGACLVVSAPSLSAQANAKPAGGHAAACKIDTTPASEADLDYYRGEYGKAEPLYAAAWKKDAKDSRSHELDFESLMGQHKLDDATKMLDAWTASDSTDPYAMIASGNMHFANGEWVEAYALMLKALKANPCLPEAYEGLASFEDAAGYHVTSNKHIAVAHQLAPNNDDIRYDWIESLQGTEQTDELERYIKESKSIDDNRRPSLIARLRKDLSLDEDHCELASLTGPPVVPMVPVYDDDMMTSWGLKVSINGHERILQIDSGSSGITLSHSAVPGLGLTSVDTSRIGGFGSQDAARTTIATAASVRVGGFEFKNCVVESLNRFGVMGGSHFQGEHLDSGQGVVGTDIFSRYLVTIDYIKHEMRLDPLPRIPSASQGGVDALGGSTDPYWMNVDRYVAPSMKSWTNIYRLGHQLIIPVRINEEIPALFIADTGSDGNTIDKRTAKKVTTTQTGIGYTQGFSGVTRLSETGKFTLDFAGLRLPVKGMDALDLSRFGGIQGFLGYPTLEQLVMHFDYRDNLAMFEAPSGQKISK